MSNYLNNPDIIYNYTFDINNNIENEMVNVINEIIPSISINNIKYTQISGGITNILYLVTINEDFNIILRLFGQGTSNIIDRNLENKVFSSLSSFDGINNNINIPIFYGLFTNGRLESYFNDTRPITPDEMYIPTISKSIAETLAIKFHQYNLNNISNNIFIWNKIERFFNLSIDTSFPDNIKKQNQFQSLDIVNMKNEYENLKSFITNKHIEIQQHDSSLYYLGLSFAYEKSFCHNDLLSGNILINKNIDLSVNSNVDIKYIDFEYAAYNYRCYDIANHFCEYAGFDFNIKEKFPNTLDRNKFMNSYVNSLIRHNKINSSNALAKAIDLGLLSNDANMTEFIKGIDEALLHFTLLSHFFWGTWSVVQSRVSTIDFNYLDYAVLRYQGYHYHKQLFNINI